MSWTKIDLPTDVDLNSFGIAKDGNTLIATGQNGTIVISKDGGTTWDVQKLETDSTLLDIAISDTGDFITIVGNDGTIITDLNLAAQDIRSTITLAALKNALLQLPQSVQQVSYFEAVAALQARIDFAKAASENWTIKLKESKDRLIGFSVATPSDVENEWTIQLLNRIPGVVLLLFLLATLNGLYRYNLKMVGFYHSRADALELLATRIDNDKLSATSEFLAADKVEFKSTKTPADMATEITKELISKLNIKAV